MTRDRLPSRRQAVIERRTWRTADGAELAFHVTVGFAPGAAGRFSRGKPLEVFLRPTIRTARTGAVMHAIADDIGEHLSLLLQHGMTAPELARRFKPGSLSRAAAAWVVEIAGAGVDPASTAATEAAP